MEGEQAFKERGHRAGSNAVTRSPAADQKLSAFTATKATTLLFYTSLTRLREVMNSAQGTLGKIEETGCSPEPLALGS